MLALPFQGESSPFYEQASTGVVIARNWARDADWQRGRASSGVDDTRRFRHAPREDPLLPGTYALLKGANHPGTGRVPL